MSIKRQVSFIRDDGKESRKYDKAGKFITNHAVVAIEGEGYGFIDTDFNEICELQYEEVGEFDSDGLAFVKLNGLYGFINTDGKEICPIIYDNVWAFSHSGVALVKRNGKYGFINRDGGEVCIPRYDYISAYRNPAVKSGPLGSARESTLFEDSKIREYSEWSESGFAIIFSNDPEKGLKKGLVNTHGEVVVEADKYDDISLGPSSSHQYIPVSINGKWGYIDKSGNEVTKIAYGNEASYVPLGEKTCLPKDGLYGIINEKGEELCPFKYEDIGPFANGYAAVEVDGKWGYINEQFEEICPIIYDIAYRFGKNGYAEVYIRGRGGYFSAFKHGYINGKGEFFKKIPRS